MTAETGRADSAGFTLENSGEGNLAVSAATSDAWLEVSPGEDVIGPRTGESNGTRYFTVTAACGEAAEEQNGLITLTTNDPDEPTKTVAVTLVCTEPPPASSGAPEVHGPNPAHLEMSAEAGRADSAGFTLENSGEGNLAVSAATSDAWLEVSPGEDVIGPRTGESNGTRYFTVTAACGEAAEEQNGLITLTTNDPDEPTKTVAVTLACTEPPPPGDFQIDILYFGGHVTAERQRVFEQAAARWAEVISGDLSNTYVTQAEVDSCLGIVSQAGTVHFTGAVDDVLMLAGVAEIDGYGGTVGLATACYLRQANRYPYLGLMVFDAADVPDLEADGTFTQVILHEMGHVLDFNQFSWDRSGLLYKNHADCLEATVVRFKGSDAKSEWAALGGSGEVPVEDNGSEGTACSHWKEELFGNELMTGYLDPFMSLSRLTVGALDDIGYVVNYDRADPYSLPAGQGLHTQSTRRYREVLLPPIGVRTPEGSVLHYEESHPLILDLQIGPGAN